ncbi:MAG: hypothetical protein LBR87_03595 [Synergistaceae bacterium]|nr:hypothetical protein [Synergistaceae bacterium]
MNKKIILLAGALVLLAAGVFAWKSGLLLPPDAGQKETVTGPEVSIPGVSDRDSYVYAKVADTESLSSSISFLSEAILKMTGSEVPAIAADFAGEDVRKTLALLGMMKGLADTSSQIAVCAASGDVTELYASLFVDGGKFDAFVASSDSASFRFEEWATDKAGPEGRAWVRKSAGSKTPDLYITKRDLGDRSLVNVSASEAGIDSMNAAASDASKRMSADRVTEGPNFAMVKFREPMTVRGLSVGSSETSWSAGENRVNIQSYSDVYAGIAAKMSSRDFSPSRTPMLGDGELALYVSLDPLFYSHLIFPGEEDPMRRVLSVYGGSIPENLAGEFKTILENSRLSVVVTTKDNLPNTVYAVLDTAAVESVDRLFGLASLIFRPGESLEGWDSASTMPLPGKSYSAILARKKGLVLLGVGNVSDYAKTLRLPASSEGLLAPDGVISVLATSDLLSMKEDEASKSLFEIAEDSMNTPGAAKLLGDMINLKNIRSVSLKQTLDGKGDMDVIWKSEGNN